MDTDVLLKFKVDLDSLKSLTNKLTLLSCYIDYFFEVDIKIPLFLLGIGESPILSSEFLEV